MDASKNPLFPVFLKLESLRTLLVGGGPVALEKLTAIFGNSPGVPIQLVATVISEEVKAFCLLHRVTFAERAFVPEDLAGIRIAVVAVNDRATSRWIRDECHERNILVNVADTPDLCDFYLGSVVTKGQLKLAISTNGKSPTVAKRVREVLDDAFPAEIDQLLDQVAAIRATLSGDFASKVAELNRITSLLAKKPPQTP